VYSSRESRFLWGNPLQSRSWQLIFYPQIFASVGPLAWCQICQVDQIKAQNTSWVSRGNLHWIYSTSSAYLFRTVYGQEHIWIVLIFEHSFVLDYNWQIPCFILQMYKWKTWFQTHFWPHIIEEETQHSHCSKLISIFVTCDLSANLTATHPTEYFNLNQTSADSQVKAVYKLDVIACIRSCANRKWNLIRWYVPAILWGILCTSWVNPDKICKSTLYLTLFYTICPANEYLMSDLWANGKRKPYAHSKAIHAMHYRFLFNYLWWDWRTLRASEGSSWWGCQPGCRCWAWCSSWAWTRHQAPARAGTHSDLKWKTSLMWDTVSKELHCKRLA